MWNPTCELWNNPVCWYGLEDLQKRIWVSWCATSCTWISSNLCSNVRVTTTRSKGNVLSLLFGTHEAASGVVFGFGSESRERPLRWLCTGAYDIWEAKGSREKRTFIIVFSSLMKDIEKRVVEKKDLASSQKGTIKRHWIVITVCSKGNFSWV